jgi:hypothetical protein
VTAVVFSRSLRLPAAFLCLYLLPACYRHPTGDSLIVLLIDEVESLTSARKAAVSGSEPSDAVRVVNAGACAAAAVGGKRVRV